VSEKSSPAIEKPASPEIPEPTAVIVPEVIVIESAEAGAAAINRQNSPNGKACIHMDIVLPLFIDSVLRLARTCAAAAQANRKCGEWMQFQFLVSCRAFSNRAFPGGEDRLQ
jgi:hypothetical protein